MLVPARSPHRARRPARSALVAAVLAVAAIAAGVLHPLGTGAGPRTGEPITLLGLVGSLYVAVGWVILASRPGHAVGRLSLSIGAGFAIVALLTALLELVERPLWSGPVVRALYDILLGTTTFLPALCLLLGNLVLVIWFPDGRRLTRLGRLAEGLAAATLVFLALAGAREVIRDRTGYSMAGEELIGWIDTMAYGLFGGAYGVALVDLVRRYRRSEQVTRAQIRWLLAAAALAAALGIAVVLVPDGPWWLWVLWVGSNLFPVGAIVIAITRYRLYDIDRIVSSTIAYTIVSLLLVGVFAAGIVGLQTVLAPFTNGDTIAVAASTLLVAAVFQPIRSRVQAAVDRRFHRARYDAERTVARFAERLRDQLDLPTLTADLRRATSEAVEPNGIGVWLRMAGPR
jgi:hypothetical protein